MDEWMNEWAIEWMFIPNMIHNAYNDWYTVEPLWKGQESLTKVAKFGQFQCTILYKSCLFYPSWQVTSFERPPFWVAFIEGFHCIPKSEQQF